MSRNTILSRLPGLAVVFGWDNPMGTFFAQVEREQDDDDPRDPLLLWLGSGQGEISRAEDLVEPLAPYAYLAVADLALLRADRVADADRGPTTLQRTMSVRRQDRGDPA
jgi:hypothetical protein